MLGGCHYYTFEILIANTIDAGVRNLIILLLIKIICNWQQPSLGFIKYDVHATCLVYYLFFLDRQFRGYVAILVFLKDNGKL
jgi:hypothetical protein